MIHPVIALIIVANLIITRRGIQNTSFFSKYKLYISGINAGQYYRYFTSGFLHVDMTHLLFNMVVLFFFAPIVIQQFNNLEFLIIYFSSLFLGNWFSVYYNQNDLEYTAVGASGAVVGILFSSILLEPNLELYFLLIPIPIKGYIFAVAYIIYSLIGMRKKTDNIGHTAHLAGGIGGVVVSLLLKPDIWVTSSELILTIALISGIAYLLLFHFKVGEKT